MLLSPDEARRIAEQALALSKADSCIVSLSSHQRRNLRFARNNVTTSGLQDGVGLSVESHFGQRAGSASVNQFDAASIEAAVRTSEQLARLAPENPEFMPPLGPQTYLENRAYSASTAKAGPERLAALCRPVLDRAVAGKVEAAGFLESGASFSALATSKKLFAHTTGTLASFTVSARTPDGTGSGWAGCNQNDLARLDTARLGEIAVRKTRDSTKPVGMEPGKFTVILEPSAVCDLVVGLILGLDARSADEGRSFMTRKGGGNKVGEKLFGERVTIFSDPHDDLAPGAVFSGDGLPIRRTDWVENGVLKNLAYSRFWADKQGRPPVPSPTNVIMRGGTTPISEMIANTKRGVLVTRLWYIREVDPSTLLSTGLTRDGTFLIEDGKITKPLKNFRFNESPVAVLNNIEAMGPAERARGSESEDFTAAVPPLLVKDFTFSSLSDAV